jgi:hypothetical protein
MRGVTERTALGNKALYLNKKMFQSKLTSKMATLKLYFSVIIPPVGGACFPDHLVSFLYSYFYFSCVLLVMCDLLRCASGKLVHLSSPWQKQTVDRAEGCRQATSGNSDLGKRISVVSRCSRKFFPEPPVGEV